MLHWDLDANSHSHLPVIRYPSSYNLKVVSDPGIRSSIYFDGLSVATRYKKDRYPPGSWEYAAASVYMDAHVQLGIAFLSFGLEYNMVCEIIFKNTKIFNFCAL